MHFRPADMSDVHEVFSDLSRISASEVADECGSWWAAMPRVRKLLELPNSQTEALVDESGTAIAIFGHYPSQDATARTTWFIFAQGFMRSWSLSSWYRPFSRNLKFRPPLELAWEGTSSMNFA